MIYTNRHNLPEYLYRILSYEWYGGANAIQDFSTTQFSNSPTMTILQNRHKDEISVDVMDELMKVLGAGVHLLCESALKDMVSAKTENRLFVNIQGKVVGGQYDLYLADSKTLVDYKLTKANSYIFGGRESKYSSQMNINKYILEKNGFEVNKMEIVEIYRDHDEKQVKVDSKYPPNAINLISIPAKTSAIIEYDMKNYIDEVAKLENLPDSKLPPCSAEDRWERGHKFAVMEKGKARAKKLCDTKVEAQNYISTSGCSIQNTYIEERKALPVRCIDWCEVNKWCPFYQEYLRKEGKQVNENSETNKPNREFNNFF